MLRITLHETESSVRMVLEGRIVGDWVQELSRVCRELAPKLAMKRLAIDISAVTYADGKGKLMLKKIMSQRKAKLVGSALAIQDIASE